MKLGMYKIKTTKSIESDHAKWKHVFNILSLIFSTFQNLTRIY